MDPDAFARRALDAVARNRAVIVVPSLVARRALPERRLARASPTASTQPQLRAIRDRIARAAKG